MLIFLFLLLILLFQTAITSVNLMLPVVLALIFSKPEKPLLFTLFFLGVLTDVFFLQKTGTTSLLYLTIVFIVYFYNRKYQIKNIMMSIIMALVILLIDNILIKDWHPLRLFGDMVLFSGAYYLFSFMRGKTQKIIYD